MPTALQRLSFEKSIYEIEDKITLLETEHDKNIDAIETLRNLRREAADLKKKNIQRTISMANGRSRSAS